MRNPNLSDRPIGFSLVPISFRFCVVSLVICPNIGEAPRQTRGAGVGFAPRQPAFTITSSTGGCSHDFGTSRACVSTAT